MIWFKNTVEYIAITIIEILCISVATLVITNLTAVLLNLIYKFIIGTSFDNYYSNWYWNWTVFRGMCVVWFMIIAITMGIAKDKEDAI